MSENFWLSLVPGTVYQSKLDADNYYLLILHEECGFNTYRMVSLDTRTCSFRLGPQEHSEEEFKDYFIKAYDTLADLYRAKFAYQEKMQKRKEALVHEVYLQEWEEEYFGIRDKYGCSLHIDKAYIQKFATHFSGEDFLKMISDSECEKRYIKGEAKLIKTCSDVFQRIKKADLGALKLSQKEYEEYQKELYIGD